ncbi:MAG: MFS transporter [Bacteroidaceae bacterium]|nr:MFS transporter [Prevotellaceae bacterium]MDD7658154.1 MFS transporter [Prevotellaceae bacterium]MDY5598741.1 MFS transporter [Bacteroidaceae bacterium]
MNAKVKLTVLNFMEFAVWGAYLTSMGTYLARVGMAGQIGWFYSVQGFVSLFMPALMGIVADRWMEAQRLLSLSHLLAGIFMLAASVYGYQAGDAVQFAPLFTLYTLSVAFFMPTIALSNSVAYSALDQAGLDTVKAFPPIRVFGTVGFIISMWIVDLGGMQSTPLQFGWSGLLSIVMAAYAITMPHCPVSTGSRKSLSDALGLKAFALFRNYRMALFFIFSMFLGVCLQITNGFANPFITSFQNIDAFKDTFGVQHANILISLSQMSETLCILLIPFFLKRFGIKRVMLLAMLAWVLRYLFFAVGDPGSGVVWFVLSMIVYGVAFDFFNISGSLFVDKETSLDIRNSAQGLFMMMTNGLGASIGTLSAQMVIDRYVNSLGANADPMSVWQGWNTCWYIFAGYALVVAVAFAIMFRYKHEPEAVKPVK